MQIKGLLVAILLVTVFITVWFWQSKQHQLAPDVIFTSITGKKIELSQLKGKPVIVTFWATDCASCVKEIPLLVELYNQFHPKGLEMIAVAMYYDPPNHVVEMSKAKQIPYDVALDLKAQHANAFGQVKLIPSTFLISPTSHIVMQKTGEFDMTTIKKAVEKLLKG